MIESATGLILRTRPLTDTSLIVHWLTTEFGRIATVAKGARRPKSPFAGKLDLFYEANFSFVRSRRSELHTLREVMLREANPALRHDLEKLREASDCAALVEHATETDFPIPRIHALFSGLLHHLAKPEPTPNARCAFELKLLRELGLEPDLENEKLPADLKKIAKALSDAEWSSLSRLKLTRHQVVALKDFIDRYVAYHLGESRVARRGR